MVDGRLGQLSCGHVLAKMHGYQRCPASLACRCEIVLVYGSIRKFN